jgi:acid phosphatase
MTIIPKLARRVVLLLGLGFWLSCTDNSLSPGGGPTGPASIVVSPATWSLTIGATVQFAATPKDASGNPLTGYTITWSSSDSTIATVNGTGLVTGLAAGTATITATSDGKSGSGSIAVSAAASGSFAVGVRVQSLGANIRGGPSGADPLLGTQASGTLGTIIAGPVVDAAGDGLTRWQVDFDAGPDGWAAQDYLVAVSPPPPPGALFSVTVTPNPATVQVGAALQLTATPRDSVGNVLTGLTVTWTSSDTTLATVSSGGLVTGVGAGAATITATSGSKSGTTSLTVTVPPPPGSSQFGHVFIVTEENTDYASVIGSASMPYLNSLANQYGLATNYYAVTHPSIGNYFELATGQIITNNDSYSTIVTVDNIVRRLLAAGKTWKSYAEDLPSVGYLGGDTGGYARKHNVFALLSDVANDATQAKNLVPFTQFKTDLANGTLPDFSNIVPNLCNDAHDCGLSTADNWLLTNIAPLITSPVFQRDGLLIITFDESGGDNTNGGGKVVWIAISPKSKLAYQSSSTYLHQSTLRLMLKGLGITSYPGAAASAPDMGEFFNP